MQSSLNRFDLGIRAGFLLSMKNGGGEIRNQFFIGIKDHFIAEICPFRESFRGECLKFLDLKDQLVMPGLINAHTHLAMSLFRGYEDDLPFKEWLFDRIFPIEAERVDARFVRVGAQLSALECIRFGTTMVNDMYFFPETTAEVLNESGLRGVVSQPFMDFVMPDERHLGVNPSSNRLNRFFKLLELYRNHPRIQIALGPHAPYTCSDDLLKEVARISEEHELPIHMHVSESKDEVEESLKKHGKRPVKRLFDLGILNERFLAAHLIHLDQEELELFERSGAAMIYNPDSNMKLGSGVAPISEYRRRGVRVALGTDGAASNNDLSLFGSMDSGAKLQKLLSGNTTAMVALDAIGMATIGGAKALKLDSRIGSLEVGKLADLISIRLDYPHLKPLHSILSQIVYSCQGLEVETTICHGQVLLEKGIPTTMDPAAIYAEAELIQRGQFDRFRY